MTEPTTAPAHLELIQIKVQLRDTLAALGRAQDWLDEFQGALAAKEIEYLRVKTENAKLYALLVDLKREHGFYRIDDTNIGICSGKSFCSCGAAEYNAKIEAATRGDL